MNDGAAGNATISTDAHARPSADPSPPATLLSSPAARGGGAGSPTATQNLLVCETIPPLQLVKRYLLYSKLVKRIVPAEGARSGHEGLSAAALALAVGVLEDELGT